MRSRIVAILLVSVLVASSAGVLLAGDQIDGLLAELGQERDPGNRARLVMRLATRDTNRAAAALAHLVRHDPHPDVRTAAAMGLGRITADNALELLGELLLEGGIRSVREALADGLRRRKAGGALIKLLESPRRSALERGLVIEALGRFRDPASLHKLLQLSTSGDVHLRVAALRALSNRKDSEEMVLEVVGSILGKSRNIALLMAALDVAVRRADPALIPGVEHVLTFVDPALKSAADHALRHLQYEKWRRAVAAAAGEAYAPEGTPRRPPPEPRPRFDIVYAIDGTGSVAGRLDTITGKIRERYRFLEEMGSDVRVGIVVFRGHRYPEQAQVFPLSHDLAEMGEFLDGLETGGTDTQGAAVSRGLAEGLNRMGWRWDARRSLFLVADSRCHDPARARGIAAIHLAADRTRVNVLYITRTRRTIPECILALADAGGGRVHVLD